MKPMHPMTVAALRELLRNGPTTIDELSMDRARQVIVNLLTHKLVEGAAGYRKGPRTYTITEKGARLIKSMETPPGDVAQPRSGGMAGEYRGEKPTHTRAGAMDAYALPSLWNGESTERKRPLIVGARVEPMGGRGWA